MTDEKNSRIHHDIHGRHKDTHRDNLESWEVAQVYNQSTWQDGIYISDWVFKITVLNSAI